MSAETMSSQASQVATAQESGVVGRPRQLGGDKAQSLSQPSEPVYRDPSADLSCRTLPSNCGLLELPADVRNIIYSVVFFEPRGVHIDLGHNEYQDNLNSLSGLSRTCKQIHNECHDLPYWLNIFHFHVPVLADVTKDKASSDCIFSQTHDHAITSKHRHFLPETSLQLLQESQKFVAKAMLLPQVDHMARRLNRIVSQPRVLSKLCRIHVNLGSQTNTTFVARFFEAWSRIERSLVALSTHVELQISFELRISRRLVVEYDFKVGAPDETMADMDRRIKLDGEPSLPEVSTINAVRTKIWKTFFSDMHVATKPPAYAILSPMQQTQRDVPSVPSGHVDWNEVIDRIALDSASGIMA